ncbi:Alpha/Beta hydrolase protein [Xylaria palmicola]|nr:Alpha/Beta hydrolase protein [Xylaria palmicola]
MAQQGLFRYLYLKAVVTLLRLFLIVKRRRTLVPPDSRQRRGVKIPSRDKGRYIMADIYYPDTESREPLPVLVNWHGSGFIVPNLGSDALFCARTAQHAGIAVLDADYRKGPETPFPGAVHDVEDTLLWVASQSRQFDPTRVAVSGFSAGGNLAIVAATTLRRKLAGAVNIRALLSIYPLINLAAPPETKRVPRPIRPFPPWLLRVFNDCYAPDPDTRTDPIVSPYFADVADFPDTVALVTCEGDNLRPEVQELGERLRQSNGDKRKIIEHICEGVYHGFDNGSVSPGSVEDARREELYNLATNVLKDVFKA